MIVKDWANVLSVYEPGCFAMPMKSAFIPESYLHNGTKHAFWHYYYYSNIFVPVSYTFIDLSSSSMSLKVLKVICHARLLFCIQKRAYIFVRHTWCENLWCNRIYVLFIIDGFLYGKLVWIVLHLTVCLHNIQYRCYTIQLIYCVSRKLDYLQGKRKHMLSHLYRSDDCIEKKERHIDSIQSTT